MVKQLSTQSNTNVKKKCGHGCLQARAVEGWRLDPAARGNLHCTHAFKVACPRDVARIRTRVATSPHFGCFFKFWAHLCRFSQDLVILMNFWHFHKTKTSTFEQTKPIWTNFKSFEQIGAKLRDFEQTLSNVINLDQQTFQIGKFDEIREKQGPARKSINRHSPFLFIFRVIAFTIFRSAEEIVRKSSDDVANYVHV